jgi:hypothetical protein
MSRNDARGRSFAMFFCWSIVGTIIGTGLGYFVYARQTPLFESVAVVKVSRLETNSPTVVGQFESREESNAEAGETSETGAEQVSGVRMTDDASQDLLLTDPDVSKAQSTEVTAGNDSSGSRLSSGVSVDDRLLLGSQAVLMRAVELGGLTKIQELQWAVSVRDKSVEAFVRDWVSSGKLRTEKSGDSSLGGVYQIAFRSRLPSTAEKVTQSVALAAVETFDDGVHEEEQAELFETLISGRSEIDNKLQELQGKLSALPDIPDAIIRDGLLVSADVARLNAMLASFERLQLQRDGIQQNLRRAEALLAEGADGSLVLKAVGAPMPQQEIVSGSRADSTAGSPSEVAQPSKAAQEYRRWLEIRNNLIEKIEREVAPMQEKLDALVEKKYGPNHPAVSHLQTQISRVRAQLANLPPEPGGVGIPESLLRDTKAVQKPDSSTKADNRGAANGSGENTQADGMTLAVLLKAMRAEAKEVSAEIARLDPELESLSTQVTTQGKALRQRQAIEQEISQQQSLRDSMIKAVQQVTQQHNSSEVSCELLVPAGPGVQVEPVLQSHLSGGALLGGASGAVLYCLILLSMAAMPADNQSDR